MLRHRALGRLALPRRDHKTIADADPSNAEHLFYSLDVAFNRSGEPIVWRRNLAHLQCACQSTE